MFAIYTHTNTHTLAWTHTCEHGQTNLLLKLPPTAKTTKGFPCGSAGKESACNAGDLGLIPGLGRAPGEGKGYPLQYSDLENSMDYTVYGVPKNQTRLIDFHFHFEANETP